MTKPIRPCVVHGCPEYTTRSRCVEHERQHVAKRKAEGRTGQRGTSAAWAKKRAKIMKRDLHTCQSCRRGTTLTVHHVDGDPLNDADENLVTLCDRCHREADALLRLARKRPWPPSR